MACGKEKQLAMIQMKAMQATPRAVDILGFKGCKITCEFKWNIIISRTKILFMALQTQEYKWRKNNTTSAF